MKLEPADTNANNLDLAFFCSLLVLSLVSGIYFLNLASQVAEQSGRQDGAFGIYKEHRVRLDELSEKYSKELAAARKKIQ